MKLRGVDVNKNDEMQAVIIDQNYKRLPTILEFGEMAISMACSVQDNCTKELSKDTALAIHRTCNGVVDLCRDLLGTTHQYVCLGKFTTDPLERNIRKTQQGSAFASQLKTRLKESNKIVNETLMSNRLKMKSTHDKQTTKHELNADI